MKLKKFIFKSVSSTNDMAIKKIKQDQDSGIIVAKKETKGFGARYSLLQTLYVAVYDINAAYCSICLLDT